MTVNLFFYADSLRQPAVLFRRLSMLPASRHAWLNSFTTQAAPPLQVTSSSAALGHEQFTFFAMAKAAAARKAKPETRSLKTKKDDKNAKKIAASKRAAAKKDVKKTEGTNAATPAKATPVAAAAAAASSVVGAKPKAADILSGGDFVRSEKDVLASIRKYLGDLSYLFFGISLDKQNEFIARCRKAVELTTFMKSIVAFTASELLTEVHSRSDWMLLGFSAEDLATYSIAEEEVNGETFIEMSPDEVRMHKLVSKKARPQPREDDEHRDQQRAEKERQAAFQKIKKQASQIQSKLSPILLEIAAKVETHSELGESMATLNGLQEEIQQRLASEAPDNFFASNDEMMAAVLDAKKALAAINRRK
jgi:hypothetical protein